MSQVVPMPRSGSLTLAVSFRARERDERERRVARATIELSADVQPSLTRRAEPPRFVPPALKSRANVRRRYAAKSGTTCKTCLTVLLVVFGIVFWSHAPTNGTQPKPTPQRAAAKPTATLTVSALPEATVYLNEVRRGVTNVQGKLTLQNVEPGLYKLRVSKTGRSDFHTSLRLAPGAKTEIKAVLPALTNQAELHRQRGDDLREKKFFDRAAAEYKKALELKKGPFPKARVGLARALLSLEEPEEATRQVRLAIRESKGVYPEAHTLLGNILRAQGLYNDAVKSYKTALTQAKNFSPEAHTGLALALQELSEFNPAINHLRIAIRQNADTEPILYYLLGNLLHDDDRTKEAIAAYEKFLQLAPENEQAPAIRSLIEHLKKDGGQSQ
jgi:predicted negative regulator of RcsB-dependent stress response